MLHNNRTIRDQRPKLIRLQARVALQMVQERLLVGVIIGVALLHPQELLPRPMAASTAAASATLLAVFAGGIACVAVVDEVGGCGCYGVTAA